MAATKLTWNDKILGAENPNPIEQKFTFGEVNELRDAFNSNADDIDANTAQFTDLNEQAVTSNLIEANISGTYNLDLAVSRMWLLTLTADTTISISSLPNSKAVAFTVKLTGAFVPTLTDVNVYGDAYDGSVQNLLTFNSYRTAAGVQVNDLIITNLP